MTLTREQYNTLKAYEPYFITAVNSSWARHPGQAALQVIHSVFTQATGDRRRLNGSCQSCILHLLRDCGKIYLSDRAEMEKVAENANKLANNAKKSSRKARKEVKE